MPVNRNLLRLELQRQAPDAIFRRAKPILEERFAEAKADMLETFDEHPVTQELEDGPDAHSSTIRTKKGGNLYSALGIEDGDDPTGVVRDAIETGTRLNLSQTRREINGSKITFLVPIRYPSIAEIGDKAKRVIRLGGWTTRSFVAMIERGFSGMPNYLFDPERDFKGKSRSGTAIQVKGTIRGGSFPGQRWVSDILAGFRNTILGK